MPMQEDLRTRAIAAGVGEFHWVEVPEDTALPYAVARVVSDPRPQHLAGYTGMRVTRVQVDCLARTAKAARTMAETLISALADPALVGTTKFGRTRAEGPIDLSEDVGGKTIHRQKTELFVAHRGA